MCVVGCWLLGLLVFVLFVVMLLFVVGRWLLAVWCSVFGVLCLLFVV